MSLDTSISERQKFILKENFAKIEADFRKVVSDMLIDFLEIYPESKQIFSWARVDKNGAEHKQMKGFQKHVDGISKTFALGIGKIDQIECQKRNLSRLGGLHNSKNVQYHYYTKMGLCLVANVKKYFGSSFTPELEEAWHRGYEIITHYMIQRFWTGSFGPDNKSVTGDYNDWA